jgi:hypothetical protein
MDLTNSIVEQVRMAFQRKNRLAMVCGFVLGCFIPCATFFVAHQDVLANRLYWILVAGGLLFSAKTVFDWTKVAFQSSAKAFGFCLLVEGVMTFSTIVYLSWAALVVLALINGIETGCRLALNQKQYQKQKRIEQKPVGMQQPKKVAARQTVAA